MTHVDGIRIRPMRTDDLDATVAAIRDGGWGDRRVALSFYSHHANTTVLVAEHADAIVGTAVVTASAGIGWLGLVFVAPAMRGRGLGAVLTRAGLAEFHALGCRTVLLAASDLGKPIYDRLGFVVEGHYAVMSGPSTLASADWAKAGVRPIEPADLLVLRDLDQAATGEDRGHLLRALAEGWCLMDQWRPRGFALRTSLGRGPIIARDPQAGLLLLDVLRSASVPGEVTLTVPKDNVAAMQHLCAAGFRELRSLPRMRLGDPIAWQPTQIWAIYNFTFG